MPSLKLTDDKLQKLLPTHLRLVYFLWREKFNLLDFYSRDLFIEFRVELSLYGFDINLHNSLPSRKIKKFKLNNFPQWIIEQKLLRPFYQQMSMG